MKKDRPFERIEEDIPELFDPDDPEQKAVGDEEKPEEISEFEEW